MQIPHTPTLLKVAQMDKKEPAFCLKGKPSGDYSQANFRGKFLWPYSFHS